MAKLDVKALALSLGIVWGACLLIMGLIASVFDWGVTFIALMSTLYVGYNASFLGAIIGGIWGFFDAGIGGLVIALLYNKLSR